MVEMLQKKTLTAFVAMSTREAVGFFVDGAEQARDSFLAADYMKRQALWKLLRDLRLVWGREL